MKLSRIFNEPENSLSYMERLVNDGSPSKFSFKNTTSEETNPLHVDSFPLCILYDETSKFETLGVVPDFFKLNNCMIDYTFVHPDLRNSMNLINLESINIICKPTSSSRTVKVEHFDCYLKMCYPGVLGRITRELYREHINSSIDITAILNNIINDPNIPDTFSFLPERGGKLYHHPNGDIGIVVRDIKPVGKNCNKIAAIIPAFSLFSLDRITDDIPIIIQILKHCNNINEYLLRQLIFPIIDCYFACVFVGGVQPEMHSQNFLIGIDKELNIVSIILRDLESFDKDISIMNRFKLYNNLLSYPFKCIYEEQYNYKIKHSFMYDHKLGEYFFDQLLDCLMKYKIINKNEIETKIKNYVLEKYGNLLIDFFPSDGKWYKFKNVIIDRTIPERPYIRKTKPKYRWVK